MKSLESSLKFLCVLVACFFVSITTCADDQIEESEPSACVSLLVYKDTDCSGEPLRAITFPTWATEPGSPCYHDATMPNYSVKGQRCDLLQGKWRQSVYLLSETCETKWYTQWFSPQELVYATAVCQAGLKLDYCVKGACPSGVETEEKDNVVVPMRYL